MFNKQKNPFLLSVFIDVIITIYWRSDTVQFGIHISKHTIALSQRPSVKRFDHQISRGHQFAKPDRYHTDGV